jgi:hypothetical protein
MQGDFKSKHARMIFVGGHVSAGKHGLTPQSLRAGAGMNEGAV